MPDALISRITSRGPGVGSGNSLSSSFRSPRNTTPFMDFSSNARALARGGERRACASEAGGVADGEAHRGLGEERERAHEVRRLGGIAEEQRDLGAAEHDAVGP